MNKKDNKMTTSESIWNDLKDRTFQIFALKDQPVDKFCTYLNMDTERCFISCKSSAVLPALEGWFGDKFTFELYDKYVIVSRKVK